MAYLDVTGSTAVIYARVSTDEDGPREQRPEVQVDLCREWCSKNGVAVIGVYTDKHTGKELSRPGFEAILGKILTEKPSLLVVRDQSRLTRDRKLEDIKRYLALAGTKILYVTSPDIDPDSLAGRMNDAVTGIMDQEYVSQLPLKTKDGMAKSRRDGIHIGRPATFVITEDIGRMPKGKVATELRFNSKGKTLYPTKCLSEAVLYSYADRGRSLRYVAMVENIPYSVLERYLHGTFDEEGNPVLSIPGDPESYIPERRSAYLSRMRKANGPKGDNPISAGDGDFERPKRGMAQKGTEMPENPTQKGGEGA